MEIIYQVKMKSTSQTILNKATLSSTRGIPLSLADGQSSMNFLQKLFKFMMKFLFLK